jgi:hypothetical protein
MRNGIGQVCGAALVAIGLAGQPAAGQAPPAPPPEPSSASASALPPEPVAGATAAAQPIALDLVWSVRSGLNVAVFLCGDAALIGQYNQVLKRHAAVLAMAYAAQEQRFRTAFGNRWERPFNDALTRQFNLYSLLPDRTAYCRWATALAADLVQRPAEELPALATAAAASLQPGPILVATE